MQVAKNYYNVIKIYVKIRLGGQVANEIDSMLFDGFPKIFFCFPEEALAWTLTVLFMGLGPSQWPLTLIVGPFLIFDKFGEGDSCRSKSRKIIRQKKQQFWLSKLRKYFQSVINSQHRNILKEKILTFGLLGLKICLRGGRGGWVKPF